MADKPHINIEWLHDEYDCDTCGTSYAMGAIVSLAGEVILELIPHAYCYNGDDYSSSEVYIKIIESLGYKVTEGYDE